MKNLRYTTLFGGGAIRGLSYIGTIRAFEKLHITTDTLAGSSVGSIFAALLAVGYNAEELNEIFSKVNFNLFKDISIGLGPFFAVSKGDVFLDWIRDLIESKFYKDNYQKGHNKSVTFKDIDKNLVIITTELSNFKCKEFSKFETPDFEIASAIRISCCMPGLMKPIEYNNTLLVDGDLQKSLPMWKLSEHLGQSPDRILEIRLEGYYEDKDLSGIDYANAVYSCMTAVSTAFVTEIYAQKDKYDYLVLNAGNIVVVDFNINDEKREELIEAGYNQTMNYFKNILPKKKAKLKTCYEDLLVHLLKIQKSIHCSNILKAKTEFGNLFIDLCDIKDLIDVNDYNDIRNFKDRFLENIKYPALFGKIKLQNAKYISSEISRIISNFETKIKDYNEYIENISNKNLDKVSCLR